MPIDKPRTPVSLGTLPHEIIRLIASHCTLRSSMSSILKSATFETSFKLYQTCRATRSALQSDVFAEISLHDPLVVERAGPSLLAIAPLVRVLRARLEAPFTEKSAAAIIIFLRACTDIRKLEISNHASGDASISAAVSLAAAVSTALADLPSGLQYLAIRQSAFAAKNTEFLGNIMPLARQPTLESFLIARSSDSSIDEVPAFRKLLRQLARRSATKAELEAHVMLYCSQRNPSWILRSLRVWRVGKTILETSSFLWAMARIGSQLVKLELDVGTDPSSESTKFDSVVELHNLNKLILGPSTGVEVYHHLDTPALGLLTVDCRFAERYPLLAACSTGRMPSLVQLRLVQYERSGLLKTKFDEIEVWAAENGVSFTLE